MSKDVFGDRMKGYEKDIPFPKFSADQYVYMRIDGRSFSKFTKNLVKAGHIKKPRDHNFEGVFHKAVKGTMKEFPIITAFHQSDEISLLFDTGNAESSELPFGGKSQKLLSVIPSYFTASFISAFHEIYDFNPLASFDARIAVFPNKVEAVNMFVWRYQDARRNLIQDIAHHTYGAKKLHKVSTKDKYEMIGKPEIKAGSFFKRHKIEYYDEGEFYVRTKILEADIDFASMDYQVREEFILNKYYE